MIVSQKTKKKLKQIKKNYYRHARHKCKYEIKKIIKKTFIFWGMQ